MFGLVKYLMVIVVCLFVAGALGLGVITLISSVMPGMSALDFALVISQVQS